MTLFRIRGEVVEKLGLGGWKVMLGAKQSARWWQDHSARLLRLGRELPTKNGTYEYYLLRDPIWPETISTLIEKLDNIESRLSALEDR